MRQSADIAPEPDPLPELRELLGRVARGDQEEVAQEVLTEVWRCAARFRPEKGSAMTWVLTLAHRRAVDRVRSAQAASDREHRAALLDQTPAFGSRYAAACAPSRSCNASP